MKSYKMLLNEAAKKSQILKELSPEELVSLNKCLLGILKDIASLCEKNDLTYMLGGGSCLGAIRHQGFIPWDDDLDLLMPRPDYDKFIDLLDKGCMGDRYSYTYPSKHADSPSMFLKVYKKNTVMMGLGGEDSPFPNEVFIDVFPLEGYPKSFFIQRIKGVIANLLRLCANMVAESRPLNVRQKEFYSSDKDLYRMVKARRVVGKALSIIPHKFWVCWFDSLVRNPDMTGMVNIPTGRKLYNGEVFPASLLVNTIRTFFEGVDVPIPQGYDQYLKNLYGDYMIIPPLEERERHFYTSLVLN